MQNQNGDPRLIGGASKASAAVPLSRLIVLVFVISVSLPIGWGLTSGSARAQESPAMLPAAPETTEELLALAANVPVLAARSREIAERKATAAQEAAANLSELAEAPAAIDSALTPSEIYSRGPHGLQRPGGAETEAAPAETAATQPDPEPVLIAQAAPLQTRTSAAALLQMLQMSAAAPQLSVVGATSSREARSAAAPSPVAVTAPTEENRPVALGTAQPAGPVPATRKEIEAARKARAEAVSTGQGSQTTRRRVAMHRMAAAAASSLNEATPFRTSGASSARFAGAGGESLGAGLDRAAEAISVVPGLRLENVTLSAGYSSNGLPGARSLYGSQAGLGSDMDFGASATLAYRKRFRTSSFGLTYTPSRNQRNRYSEWNSTDHVAGINYDRQIGRRWGLGVSANAANTGLEQFWFRQPVYRQVENPPTTLEELLARSDAGEFTDDEFASLLSGAPVVDDPGGREIDLSRVNSLSANVTASYAHSARMTVTMGLSASRFGSSYRSFANDASNRLAVNNISRQFGYVQAAYRFSPSMTTGVRYNGTNNSSTFGLSTSHSASGFVRQRLSRFWSAEVEAGTGFVNVDPDSGFLSTLQGTVSSRPTWTAGGSLRYRYGGHSFETFGRRQVGDSLGVSSATSMSGGVSWQWSTPRMPWVFSGGASYSKSDWGNAAFGGSSTAYETSLLQGGVTRRLTPTTAFVGGYYYGRYSSPFQGLLTGSSIHRVQASFLWRPVEAR